MRGLHWSQAGKKFIDCTLKLATIEELPQITQEHMDDLREGLEDRCRNKRFRSTVDDFVNIGVGQTSGSAGCLIRQQLLTDSLPENGKDDRQDPGNPNG